MSGIAAPDYDFASLSPYDFEVFVRDLLSAQDRLVYSTFRVGADGGIDLKAVSDKGWVVAQCKHTPSADRGSVLRAARKEAGRAAGMGFVPVRYVFVTSADLTPASERETREALSGVAGTVEVHGRGWLNAVLALHPEVERRHFKLWISSTQAVRAMMQDGVFLRGESRIQRIERNYLRFVHHEACEVARFTLEQHGCVLLSGAPGAGKTTIAEYLLLLWWHRGFRVIVDPRTVDQWWAWLEDDTPTVFFFDDVWGQTHHQDHGSRHHETDMSEFIESIVERQTGGTTAKVLIMTSRVQVLQETVRLSDASRRAMDRLAHCHVTVERLPYDIRGRMLFNHVHLAITDPQARRDLAASSWWQQMVGHRNYSPRLVELVVRRNRARSAQELIDDLDEALENPFEIWGASFRALPLVDQQLLLTLSLMDSQLAPWQEVVQRLGGIPLSNSHVDAALERLDGSWITKGLHADNRILALADPSQRDFLIRYLSVSPGAMTAIIKNAVSVDDLITVCRRGEATELENNLRLFSIGEDLFRSVLDTCARELLARLRELWDLYPCDAADLAGGSIREVTSLVEALTLIVRFHGDRYKAAGAALPGGWFADAMSRVTLLVDSVGMTSTESLAELVTELAAAVEGATPLWPARHPLAGAISEIRAVVDHAWCRHEPSIARHQDTGYEADLAKALVRYADSLAGLGLGPTIDTYSPAGVDAYLADHLEDYDPNEVAEQIDPIEDVIGWYFTDTRERLAALLDTDEEPAPSPPGRIPTVPPRPTFVAAPPADTHASLAALFRSLERPFDTREMASGQSVHCQHRAQPSSDR
ncbi:restriction endonuclease [Streptomyces longwoodensis]|uniref:nSTAND3 domain-containing NTPase n=1 Tax=Streptomyces longwoodensis TaxID=68231 RepID=UPI0036E6F84C